MAALKSQTPPKGKDAYSVTQAIRLVNKVLEPYPLTVEGEVSEFNYSKKYSNVYFTIKDENSSLPCKMWRNEFEALGIALEEGLVIQVKGTFNMFNRTGSMTLNAKNISLVGEGELRQRVANLAKKLADEGLMAEERKRRIPKYCETIGLVTSPRGAVAHDVLRTLRRRFPLARVKFAGVAVEGDSAVPQMIEGLERVAAAGAEVILLVRGGGSYASMMPFNDERLVRAVVACPVPVITGIGHEPDTTIADLVSDLRASTPTHAAEAVSPKSSNLMVGFRNAGNRLKGALERQLEAAAKDLEFYADRPIMQDSGKLFESDSRTLDLAVDKLEAAMASLVPARAERLDAAADRLHYALPQSLERDHLRLAASARQLDSLGTRLLPQKAQSVENMGSRLTRALPQSLQRSEAQVDAAAQALRGRGKTLLASYDSAFGLTASRLDDLSPLAVIRRGYAMARSEDGSILGSVQKVEPGQAISVTVADGRMDCTVDTVEHTEIVLFESQED